MDSTTLGFIAALLTTISFIPQAVKIIRTKDTQSISLGMYLVFNLGIFCWLVYGILLDELPIILANAVTIVFTLTILGYKLKYK